MTSHDVALVDRWLARADVAHSSSDVVAPRQLQVVCAALDAGAVFFHLERRPLLRLASCGLLDVCAPGRPNLFGASFVRAWRSLRVD